MTMHDTGRDLEVQTFDFTKAVRIEAPPEVTFEAVLAELGPEGEMEDGKPFPFKFEPWPGGRWYRELGDNAGHFWGHVQVIKPPKLLELCGPTFVSYPALNHVQYRLTPEDGGTHLRITHRAFGYMPRDFIRGADQGWEHGLRRIAEIAGRLKGGK